MSGRALPTDILLDVARSLKSCAKLRKDDSLHAHNRAVEVHETMQSILEDLAGQLQAQPAMAKDVSAMLDATRRDLEDLRTTSGRHHDEQHSALAEATATIADLRRTCDELKRAAGQGNGAERRNKGPDAQALAEAKAAIASLQRELEKGRRESDAKLAASRAESTQARRECTDAQTALSTSQDRVETWRHLHEEERKKALNERNVALQTVRRRSC